MKKMAGWGAQTRDDVGDGDDRVGELLKTSSVCTCFGGLLGGGRGGLPLFGAHSIIVNKIGITNFDIKKSNSIEEKIKIGYLT